MADGTDPATTSALMVYGSCVSRDLVEVALGGRRSVARYTARQSLPSAFDNGQGTLVVPADAPVSSFQRRMVQDDLRSALPRHLREVAARGVRTLLWDLVDERLGVYVLPDESVVTRSIDLMASGMDGVVAESATLEELGTPEHLLRWSHALDAFRALTVELELHVVLLDIPWAERDDLGDSAPDSFGTSAATANRTFRPYVELAAQEFRVISVPPGDAVAAHDHPWGRAPFHYVASTYAKAAAQI